MGEKEKKEKLEGDLLGNFECPDEHADLGLPDHLNDPIDNDEGRVVVGYPPPQPTY